MITPAQLLNSSAVRYQTAINNLLKFWHLNGQCKYCSVRADVKQLMEQQIASARKKEEVKTLV